MVMAKNTLPEIASHVLRQTQDPDSGLNEAVHHIKDALKAIDPSIRRVGAVYSFGTDGRFNRLSALLIDRPDDPMMVNPNRGDDYVPDHPDAVLFQLIEQWRHQYDVSSNSPDAYEDVADDPEFQRLLVLEDKITAIRPATLRGLAAKMLVLTGFGVHLLDESEASQALIHDCLALSGGVLPPSTHEYGRAGDV